MAGSVGSEDGDVGFQIAPMVDVVFVLLLFFMASAGSQVIERELNISLPSGRGRPAVRLNPCHHRISRRRCQHEQEGLDTRSAGTPRVARPLKENIERFGDKDPVIIRPDETPGRTVIDVPSSRESRT